MIFWLYGRSGAGKTTLSERLEAGLRDRGLPTFLLDGDELRGGLCSDLGFGEEARTENHRRAAEMAKLIANRGIVVIAATMAPQHAQRDAVHDALGERAKWIYVEAPWDICARRDPKGLYARAERGEIDLFKDFPFDTPRTRDVDFHLETEHDSVDASYRKLLSYVLGELNDFAI